MAITLRRSPKRRANPDPDDAFRRYLAAYDKDFNEESLQYVREMEDYLIETGHMLEVDRMPTPKWMLGARPARPATT